MNKPKDPDCANTTSYDYVPLLAGGEHYKKFNFYVMTVLHIFVPFAILVILNISIVVLTKRKIHGVSWAMATLIDMPKVTEMIRKGLHSVSLYESSPFRQC
ncbi:hypothetical protein COOONC_24788 [Cooperia oncophora]